MCIDCPRFPAGQFLGVLRRLPQGRVCLPEDAQVADECHELRFLIACPQALISGDRTSEGFGIEPLLADSMRHRLTAPDQKSRTRLGNHVYLTVCVFEVVDRDFDSSLAVEGEP